MLTCSYLDTFMKATIQESKTLAGAREFVESHGLELIDLDLQECRSIREKNIPLARRYWGTQLALQFDPSPKN